MITRFGLRDLPVLKRLQGDSVSLCPMEALIRHQSPLWTALTSRFALDGAESFTFVLNGRRRADDEPQGFAQVRRAPTRPEMYLQHLAPHLQANGEARTAWSRLLNHIVSNAAEWGTRRIFASTSEDGDEKAVLLGNGFSAYTREDTFCLAPDAHPQAAAQPGIRPEQSTDIWEVNRLYRAVVPHLVQQAESLAEKKSTDWVCGPLTWSHGEGFVLEDRDGIAGYGHLMPGRVGHWLTIVVHSRAYGETDKLLDYGLALLSYYPPYPVYCAVRPYQGGVRPALEARGFELHSVQCCLVKHTAVRVKERALGLVPSLEKRVEAPGSTVVSEYQHTEQAT